VKSLRTIGLIASAYGALILLASVAIERSRRTRPSCDTLTSSTTSNAAKASEPTTEPSLSSSQTASAGLPAPSQPPHDSPQSLWQQYQGLLPPSTQPPDASTLNSPEPINFGCTSYSPAYKILTPPQLFWLATKRLLSCYSPRQPISNHRISYPYSSRMAWSIWRWSLGVMVRYLIQKIRKG
jgi:hypothetical protein